jgi:hypothetical protein
MLIPRLTTAALLASAVSAYAGPTILLDDFDNDDSDELFGPLGLLAFTGGLPPKLSLEVDAVTGDDIGRVSYSDIDPTPAGDGFAVALYPNNSNNSLQLDLPANDIVGFELVLGDRTNLGSRTEFPVGFRLLDDGPTSATRLSASFDALVPAGTGEFVVSAMLSDFQFIDSGFEFDDIRQITWGLNAQNAPFGLDSQAPTVTVDVLEFRAIVPEPATASLVAATAGLLLRRRRA